MIVGLGHTHPSNPGDLVYGNCAAIDEVSGETVPAPRWPGDPTAHKPVTAGVDYKNGGGSDQDWKLAGQGFDVYAMNRNMTPLDPTDPGAEGEIFKLPGGWDLNTQKMQDLDTRRKTWGQICGWK